MSKCNDRPIRGAGMTSAAFTRRWNMRHTFTRSNFPVVATAACATHLSMVDATRRTPSADDVTGFAFIRCRDMFRALARRLRAVMTTYTITRNADVIEGRRPIIGGVATVTLFRRWNVVR